jgi:hypothetical protein
MVTVVRIHAGRQFFISVLGPLFPLFFLSFAEFNTRNFCKGFLRVASNFPSFHVAVRMMMASSRRCSDAGWDPSSKRI